MRKSSRSCSPSAVSGQQVTSAVIADAKASYSLAASQYPTSLAGSRSHLFGLVAADNAFMVMS